MGLILRSHVCRTGAEPVFTPGLSPAGRLPRGRQGREPDPGQPLALDAGRDRAVPSGAAPEVLPDAKGCCAVCRTARSPRCSAPHARSASIASWWPAEHPPAWSRWCSPWSSPGSSTQPPSWATARQLDAALDWLLSRQSRIEQRLARQHPSQGVLVLYDVSSTCCEGRTCPLARHGYSRDGKRQIADRVRSAARQRWLSGGDRGRGQARRLLCHPHQPRRSHARRCRRGTGRQRFVPSRARLPVNQDGRSRDPHQAGSSTCVLARG